MVWSVYIILCHDGSLYTGITTDVQRRFRQHQQLKGAKYFRIHRPQSVLFVEDGHSHSSALAREAEIKALSRPQKLQWLKELRLI